MAEVLGLVASGISVAQVAWSLVTASLKLKALLDEVKDAPDNLREMLDHLELLTPILCEATTDSDDAAGSGPPRLSAPSNVQQVLQKALTACQTASEQLELMATDLTSQIDVARRGMRRKRAMLKVVLKRGVLARYEMRLQKTIMLLTLAQNTYMIALQRIQPETIASQIMLALAQSPQAAHSHGKVPEDKTPSNLQVATKATDHRISTSQNPTALHEYLQLGFAKMTGLIRLYTPPRDRNSQTTTSTEDRFLRIQLQMPTWLCASVLDAAFARSYAGWTCSLNVYGNIHHGSVECTLLTNAMESDDVDAMHRLFQERRCSPRDHFVFAHKDRSLMEHALEIGAWQASGYLLNHGAEYGKAICYVRQSAISTQNNSYLEDFLIHNELSDQLRLCCLASYSVDLNSFKKLVGRLWPYGEFYESYFGDQRLDLATALVEGLGQTSTSTSAIFHHLCGTLLLEEAGSATATTILSCLAIGLGHIVWHDLDFANEWYSVILGTALRLKKAFAMPEQQSPGSGTYALGFVRLFRTSTPFTNLSMSSLIALPGHNRDQKRARQHRITYRLANTQRAVQKGLETLRSCGIDLLEYGKQEKQRLLDHESGYDFRIFRDAWYDREGVVTRNGLFETRLISFEYGSQPEDWKLWWSEPTDELVGDFWREMEPEALCIPGSWDEDL